LPQLEFNRDPEESSSNDFPGLFWKCLFPNPRHNQISYVDFYEVKPMKVQDIAQSKSRVRKGLVTLLGITLGMPFLFHGAAIKPSVAQGEPVAQVNGARKVKLFIVEGTDGNKAGNFAMGVLYDRYQGAKFYNDGPPGDCKNCGEIMVKTATNMCDSLRSGEATHIALAGSSRGAYLTRAALIKAQRDICPELNPESRLVWGGFVDPIPWAMQESNLVNDWGNWKKGVPGLNIVKEKNVRGLLGLPCNWQSFPARYLPTLSLDVCHGWLNGQSTQSPSMQDFILGRLIANASTSVPEMVFSPIPPHVSDPYGCWVEIPGLPFLNQCGIAKVRERPAVNE
jgi:hypothetical protein